jgi:hypothetical protein
MFDENFPIWQLPVKLVTKETVWNFGIKRMNIHYVDANNYNMAECAWIKMSLFR